MNALIVSLALLSPGQLPPIIAGEDHFAVTDFQVVAVQEIDAETVLFSTSSRLISDTPAAWKRVSLRLTNLPDGVENHDAIDFIDIPAGQQVSAPRVDAMFILPRSRARALRKYFAAGVFESEVVAALEQTVYADHVLYIDNDVEGCAEIVRTISVTAADGLLAPQMEFARGTAPIGWRTLEPGDVVAFSGEYDYPSCCHPTPGVKTVPHGCDLREPGPEVYPDTWLDILDVVVDETTGNRLITYRPLLDPDASIISSGTFSLSRQGEMITEGGSSDDAFTAALINGTNEGTWPSRPMRQIPLGPDLQIGGNLALHRLRIGLIGRIRGGQLRQVGVEADFDLDAVMMIRALKATVVEPREETFYEMEFALAGNGFNQTKLTLSLVGGGEGAFTTAGEVSFTRSLHATLPTFIDFSTSPPTMGGTPEITLKAASPVEPTVALAGEGYADAWVGARVGLKQEVGVLNDLQAELGAYGHFTFDLDTAAPTPWAVDNTFETDVVIGGHLLGIPIPIADVPLAIHDVPGARQLAQRPAFADGPKAIGNTLRWSTGFSAPAGNSTNGVVALRDGGALILSGSRTGIARIDRLGTPVFGFHAVSNASLRRAHELDDGRLFLVGENSGLWLVLFSADGTSLARARYVMPGATPRVREIHVTPLEDGRLDVVFTGQAVVAGADRSFAARGVVDPDALDAVAWTWSATYDDPTAVDPAHLRLADSVIHDGRLVVVGVNHHLIPTAPEGTATHQGAFTGTINLETGVMERSQQYGAVGGARLNAIAVGPTGRLVAVGFHGRTKANPSTLVMNLEPDGAMRVDPLLDTNMSAKAWSEDLGWTIGDGFNECCTGEIPFGGPRPGPGDSNFDEVFDIVAARDGFFIAGKTENAAQGWLIHADPEGEVRWFQRISTPGTHTVGRLAINDTGLFTLALSTGPQASGLSTSTSGHLVLTRAPFEGLVQSRIPGALAVMAKAGGKSLPANEQFNGFYAATFNVRIDTEARAMGRVDDIAVTFQDNVEFLSLSRP